MPLLWAHNISLCQQHRLYLRVETDRTLYKLVTCAPH